MGERVSDRWEVGEGYERYIGRWSRLLAPRFLSWLAIPPGRRWLDVGCGTGALPRHPRALRSCLRHSLHELRGLLDSDPGRPGPGSRLRHGAERRGADRLRDLLRERLPTQPDGAIALNARVWAVRGTVA